MDGDGFGLIDLSDRPDILALCDAARAEMDAFGYKPQTRIQDLWQRGPAVRALATLPDIMEPLEAYFGRRAIPFQTLNFKYGSQQEAHSDLIHFTPDPIHLMCGIWMALEDVHPDAGPLFYYKGSHTWPVLTMQDAGAPDTVPPDQAYSTHYVPAMAAQLAARAATPSLALVKKGQALIWSANLVHGGTPRHDNHSTRYSQVTHVFFEDSAYHTLMFERSGQRKHRLPRNIRTGQLARPSLPQGQKIPLKTKLATLYHRLTCFTPSW
jgi:ectoine hydroxylase-related dioxygenase (phytanoyl-CoA dioxygenase family)